MAQQQTSETAASAAPALTLKYRSYHYQKDPRLADDLQRIVDAVNRLQQAPASSSQS